MKLGRLSLENNLILAPMENVTTGPYRDFSRKIFKVGLVCVPMIHAKRLMASPKSMDIELHNIEKQRPISIQIIGSEREPIKRAAEYLESYDFDVLDINAGCPSKRAIRLKKGGYFTKDLSLMKKVVETAVKHSSKPISLKTRIGFNKERINELSTIINDTDLEFLTIHARTVKDRYNDQKINLDAVKQLKEKSLIPIVGNGDINTPQLAKNFIEKTQVDALMIGRATKGNPEIFKHIHDYLNNDKMVIYHNLKENMEKYVKIYRECIERFLEGATLKYPKDEFRIRELRRNSIWLTKKIENSTILRTKLSKAKSYGLLNAILDEYFKNI